MEKEWLISSGFSLLHWTSEESAVESKTRSTHSCVQFITTVTKSSKKSYGIIFCGEFELVLVLYTAAVRICPLECFCTFRQVPSLQVTAPREPPHQALVGSRQDKLTPQKSNPRPISWRCRTRSHALRCCSLPGVGWLRQTLRRPWWTPPQRAPRWCSVCTMMTWRTSG